MKRADIHVGDELFYRSGKYGSGEKAVVVDTDRYVVVESGWGNRPKEPYAKHPQGTAVLVDVHVSWSATPRVERKAVPLASLHGPYETVKAAELAARRAEQERKDAADVARDARRIEAKRLTEQAEALGITGVRGDDYECRAMRVPLDVLAMLLDFYVAKEG
jgi:hypothetical protein